MNKNKFYLIVCLHLISFFYLKAQTWSQKQKITATNRASGSQFGLCVDISDQYAICGANNEDRDEANLNSLSNAGAAYFFERDMLGNWNQVQKVTPSQRLANDKFGESVAISGNYAVVGAHLEDEDENDINTLGNEGSAYIYERDGLGTWNFVQKIKASDKRVGDYFGIYVDISGPYLVVGAHRAGVPGTRTGQAYVFERDVLGVWTEKGVLVPSDGTDNDWFGWRVSIDSNRIAVAARGEGAGYVYERDIGGNWNETDKIVPIGAGANELVGQSIAISGVWVVIGAQGEDYNVAGGAYKNNAGASYFFKYDGLGNWNETQKVVAFDRTDNYQFGGNVNMDDEYTVIGSNNHTSGRGIAYI